MSQIKEAIRPLRDWLRDMRKPKVKRQNARYDRATSRILARLKDDSTCIDIGAARGTVLSEIIDNVPNGTFFAFEARPEAAAKLEKKFPGTTVHSMALGNEAGEATFNVVDDNPAYSGLRRRSYPAEYEVREITVPIGRLDEVIPADVKVDFVKLDVEGAEYAVLEGAARIFREHKPLLVFEYGSAGKDQYGVTPQMMFELLKDYGLRVSTLPAWLKGKPPMTLAEFERQSVLDWYFVAHAA